AGHFLGSRRRHPERFDGMGARRALHHRGDPALGPPLRPADEVLAQPPEPSAGSGDLGLWRLAAAERSPAPGRPHAAGHRAHPRPEAGALKPARFEYHAPTSVDEAVRLLAGLGESGRPLAGGQSLMPLLNL